MLMVGYQDQSSEQRQSPQGNSKYFMSEGPINEYEMERYEDKTQGYIITVPRSWGVYPAYGGFYDEFYDGMETIGPLVGNSAAKETMTIEVWDENTIRKSNQSLVDAYIDSRLNGLKYDKQDHSEKFARIVRYDSEGKYRDTCKLSEHKNKLYVFCYQQDNSIHTDIINSIEFM